jgi:PTS system nitrogen regulatory IIA component
MDIADLVAADGVIAGLRATGKRQVLEELARRAAAAVGLDTGTVLSALLQREELGSTGVGKGIAIPHARMPGISTPFVLLAQLERPIDFAAIDDQPVDLVCLLLTPAGAASEHLPALACISRRLREKTIADRLRGARDGGALHAILTCA